MVTVKATVSSSECKILSGVVQYTSNMTYVLDKLFGLGLLRWKCHAQLDTKHGRPGMCRYPLTKDVSVKGKVVS